MFDQDPQSAHHEAPAGGSTFLTSDESPYLLFAQTGPHWHGYDSLKHLFVFGDSYSSRLSGSWDIDENASYDTSGDDATWTDFFASSVSSHSTTATLLKNFAFPGATVEYDLDNQLARFFSQFSGDIEPGEATFIFFLGINDCGGLPGEDLSSLVEALFDAMHQLYDRATARNFVLVDVPPTDRSPAAAGTTIDLASRIAEWNDAVTASASDFISNSTQATTVVFSSHRVLSGVLDNPGAYGFAESARRTVGRGIWGDSLHLAPAVHEIIASRMLSALGAD